MEWGGTMSCALPPMGNMYLYEAGSAVAVGYGDDASVPQENNADADESDPISGKTIVCIKCEIRYCCKWRCGRKKRASVCSSIFVPKFSEKG